MSLLASSTLDVSLRFLDTVLDVRAIEGAGAIAERIVQFFASHVTITPGVSGRADVSVVVAPYGAFTRAAFDAPFTPVVIRRASAEAFNLDGEKAEWPGHEVVDSPATGTAVVLRRVSRTAHLYVSDRSFVQAIEFLRDLIIKREEQRGTLVLHAAAAVFRGGALAIVGAKGAGKSTVLIDLLGRRGWRLLSGDKLFLRVTDDGIAAHGWPDYPHLGFGTIARHPGLMAAAAASGYQIDPRTPARKVLLPPASFEAALAVRYARGPVPLRSVMFPDVLGAIPTSLRRLDGWDPARVEAHLEFTAQNPFSRWHTLVESADPRTLAPVVRRLAELLKGCNGFVAQGPGPLTEAQVRLLQSSLESRRNDG